MENQLDGIPQGALRRRLGLVALVSIGLALLLIGVLLALGRADASASKEAFPYG